MIGRSRRCRVFAPQPTEEAAVFHRVLACYDGSISSMKALEVAVQLASEQSAELCCLSVEEGLPTYAGTIDEFDEVKKERDAFYITVQEGARQVAARHGLSLSTKVVPGHPAQTIVRVAKEDGYDLVVLGHAGHSHIWGSFMGTTAEKVSRHAPCAVLIVR
jgi:nucleotide-binding universal stress UspA family protein